MSLSGKERRFIAAYARCHDPREAAREAGYKDSAGTRTAKRILQKEEALALFAEFERNGAGQSANPTSSRPAEQPGTVSLASLTEELEEARCRAVDAGQSSAAIAATMGKAKLHGLDHPKKGSEPAQKAPEKIERVIVTPENSNG